MKKYLFIAVLLIGLISCKKDDNKETIKPIGEYQYLNSIYAGQISGIGIKYVDLYPDDTLKTGPYVSEYSKSYDLNGNDTADFKIIHYRSSPFMLGSMYSSLNIIPLEGNEVCVLDSNNTLAFPFNYNQIIDSNKIWRESEINLYYYYASSMNGTTIHRGFWENNDKYFVGVRVKSGEKYLYGWFDVRCTSYYSFSSNFITRYAITTPYLN